MYLIISKLKIITNSISSVSKCISINDSKSMDTVAEITLAAATSDAAQACATVSLRIDSGAV